MKQNLGKKFEQNFKKSIPDNVFYYRFKDCATSYYGGNNNLRFSQSNIADCMIFNGEKLFICELKNHKGKSLPLTCIRENQKEEMLNANKYSNVIPLLIVFFSDVERCFALNIQYFKDFIEKEERKSIPIDYFEKNGQEIKVTKKISNYIYDLNDLINKKD